MLLLLLSGSYMPAIVIYNIQGQAYKPIYRVLPAAGVQALLFLSHSIFITRDIYPFNFSTDF
jgi:hypothetical protein